MGNFLLHGHLHHGTDPKWASKVQRIYERQINIGVDFNNYYPVALDKLASDIVKIREGKL
jgi:calcineurin-like phosphoesterase family protein